MGIGPTINQQQSQNRGADRAQEDIALPSAKESRQAPQQQAQTQAQNKEQEINRLATQNHANRDPSPAASRGADRTHRHHPGQHTVGGETVEHEQADRIAFKAIGPVARPGQQPATMKERAKDAWSLAESAAGGLQEPGSFVAELGRGQTTDPTVTGDGSSSHGAAARRFESQGAEGSSRDQSAGLAAGEAGLAQRTAPQQERVKLGDLLGADAVANFRERLREVWVTLDEGAAQELDVIGRRPVDLGGARAADLLAVQSPQGVHFVAFIRNRNDFEVLATFDRHSLLPGNPTKQLLEAAVVAYQQTGTVFEVASTLLGDRVKGLAAVSPGGQIMLDGVRQSWVLNKRRKKKFDDLADQVLSQLDELSLTEEIEKVRTAENQSEGPYRADLERAALANNGDDN